MTNQPRVLIVDDESLLAEMYQKLLTAEGMIVETAGDGEAGLAKITEGGYDLVLLDIRMPKMDGLEVLRQIGRTPVKRPNGPIVVLTNHAEGDLATEARTLGAAGFLIKATDTTQFVVRIKAFLEPES